MKAALSAMLSNAVDDGIIVANPAFQLGHRKTSRADRLTPADRLQKIRPMTWEERDAFLEAVAAVPRYNAFFATLAKAASDRARLRAQARRPRPAGADAACGARLESRRPEGDEDLRGSQCRPHSRSRSAPPATRRLAQG